MEKKADVGVIVGRFQVDELHEEPADAPWKASKKGLLDSPDLELVYKDGVLVKNYNFDMVRENANMNFR